MTFKEMGLAPAILSAIEEVGYTEPTPIQAEAIPHIMAGRDVIGSAQTGTGKTAAFALPALHRLGKHTKGAPRCLVLGPTRELAAQVKEQFAKYGKASQLQCTLVHGGVGYGRQLQELEAGSDVVIATPGRLLDHVRQKTIDLRSVELLILDEVDRMLDMGFIEDVTRIIRHCSNRKRQTLLFSATVSEAIKRIISRHLREPVEVAISVRISPAETVKHEVYPVGAMQKFDLLVALIECMEVDSMIIFCRMKMGADRITRWLQQHAYEVAAMHSDLNQKVRSRSLQDFKEGKVKILVATDIASRGLDIANVTHVINYDVPEHCEDYVHRIGRTGRARREGDAATLLAPDEESKLDAIEKFIDQLIPQRRLEGFNYIHEPRIRETTHAGPKRRRRNSASSKFGRRR